MNESVTLPQIHSNGTSRAMLREGYDLAGEKLEDFIRAWGGIEFNGRDYYLIAGAWEAALDEREAISLKIRDVQNYLNAIRQHLYP